MKKIIPALLACLAFGASSSAWAVRPLSADIALVAGGEGRPGFRDGPFTSALFNQPMGLSINRDGTLLFVADCSNNRVRVIHLDENNEVTTLAGQDAAGRLDGPVSTALFHHPKAVLCLPGSRLVVNDSENQLLRLVDLKAGTVTTLAGGSPFLGPGQPQSPEAVLSSGPASLVSMKGVREMVYMDAANSIFFTQPEVGALKRLDLRSGLVSIVLNHHSQIPRPAALVCLGNKLYAADLDLQQVYEMEWNEGAPVKPLLVTSTQAKVLSLSLNGGVLYSQLQIPGAPAQRFFLDQRYMNESVGPENQKLVSFRSPWGDAIPKEALFPPRDKSFFPNAGLVADPRDCRKFFLSKPDYHMVVCFRDLFGFEWNPSAGERNSNGLDGPEYPAQKPKDTYRIILVGDSRSAEVQNFPFQSDYHSLKRPNDNPYFPHILSLAPQMERELNLLAAVDGAPLNYEVFNFSRHGDYLVWPAAEVPDCVKRNDIDLVVLFMTEHFPPETYFDHPLDKDGMPVFPNDMEFLAKDPLDRLPKKGMARKFYDFCKDHGLVSVRGNALNFEWSVFDYPELHEDLVEMYGKPLDLLNRRVSALRTSGGQPVRVILCNTYTGRPWEKNIDMPLWFEAAKKYNFQIWDLNQEMNAVNLSFFPLTGDGSHLDPDGSSFFGRLLAHDLIRDKLIPYKTRVLGE